MKKHRKSGSWQGRSARFVALGTLAVAAMGTAPKAYAAHAKPDQAQVATTTFDLAAGSLPEVLDAWKKASGISLALHLSPETVAGFHSRGVHGAFTNEDALKQILDGTGLGYHFERGGTRVEILIVNADQVSVTASTNSVGLGQFTESLTDTAQTVNVVPQYIMQEQAVTGLRDSLRNAPGISIAAGEAGAQGDNLTIRGFSARNDIYLDGIRDFGSYYRDSFDYESVDVLQGPASVEFGRGSTGGVVNQESKQPVSHRFFRPDVQFGTNALRRGTLDVNVPFGDLLPNAAFRLNAIGMETGVSERNTTFTRRWGVAPTLAFGLGKPTRGFIAYLHEGEHDIPDYGLPYFGPGLPQVSRKNYYGLANSNYLDTTPHVLTGRIEQDLGANWTFRSTLRFGYYPRNVQITEPQINTVGIVSGAGTTASPYVVTCSPTAGGTAGPCYPITTPLSTIQVRRATIEVHSVEDDLWNRNEAIGHVRVARLEHDLSVAIEGGRERSNPQRPGYLLANGNTYYNYTNLVNPTAGDAFAPPRAVVSTALHVSSQGYAFNVLDTVKLTRWLQLSGGIRLDYFNTFSQSAATASSAVPVYFSHLDKKPTYRAAAVVKPSPNGSVYFDYGTSFNPSAESLSLSANSATFPPEENATYEVGAKWDFLRNKLNLNGSLFRTEKLNARETDPLNSANSILSGTQLVRGLQVGAVGHMPSHFDIIAGYAYLDARIESSVINASPFAAQNVAFYTAYQNALKTNPNAVIDPRYNTAPFYLSPKNFPFANVPKNSGNLWVTRGLPFRFVGGFGGNYVAARRASSTSVIGVYQSSAPTPLANVPLAFKAIPSYIVLNAMVSRPITDRLALQVNLVNLTNRYFIDQPHPNHLVPGEGINAQFGATYHF